jgi:hypothetical protein
MYLHVHELENILINMVLPVSKYIAKTCLKFTRFQIGIWRASKAGSCSGIEEVGGNNVVNALFQETSAGYVPETPAHIDPPEQKI